MIFLLGDGMGESEITIARNYQYGAAGRLPGIDTPPLTGDITTYALQEADPSKPEYVTDSAASGTGWATGQQDLQRPHLDDGQDRPDTADDLRAGRQEGLGDRQRLDRRDHRRHARGARLARQRARLPGPGRHGRVPEVQEVGGRARLDRRAGGRPQVRRHPRRRQGALRSGDRRRPVRRQDGRRPGQGARLHRRDGRRRARRRQEGPGARPLQQGQHEPRVEGPARGQAGHRPAGLPGEPAARPTSRASRR